MSVLRRWTRRTRLTKLNQVVNVCFGGKADIARESCYSSFMANGGWYGSGWRVRYCASIQSWRSSRRRMTLRFRRQPRIFRSGHWNGA
jgi:hypothetical protein